jgi:hypothetical protein
MLKLSHHIKYTELEFLNMVLSYLLPFTAFTTQIKLKENNADEFKNKSNGTFFGHYVLPTNPNH